MAEAKPKKCLQIAKGELKPLLTILRASMRAETFSEKSNGAIGLSIGESRGFFSLGRWRKGGIIYKIVDIASELAQVEYSIGSRGQQRSDRLYGGERR
jgi:hypothetical protein